MLTTGALDMAKSSRTAQMIDTTGVALPREVIGRSLLACQPVSFQLINNTPHDADS